MKIENIHITKDVILSDAITIGWDEAKKLIAETRNKIRKIGKGKIAQALSRFWRKNKWYFLFGALTVALWGFGLLPIMIYIIIL